MRGNRTLFFPNAQAEPLANSQTLKYEGARVLMQGYVWMQVI